MLPQTNYAPKNAGIERLSRNSYRSMLTLDSNSLDFGFHQCEITVTRKSARIIYPDYTT